MRNLVLALVTLTLSAPSFAATYKVDLSHSQMGFSVRHLFSKVPGKFNEFEGTFNFDEKTAEKGSADFTIKTASIDTDTPKRDDHLRSPDFFDAQKYPTITFKSKSVRSTGKNKYKLSGDLMMHGVTKPVTFDAEYLGTDKDPWGNTKVGFTASTKINRKDFGIVWNKKLDSGNLLLSEEVELNIQIEADQQK